MTLNLVKEETLIGELLENSKGFIERSISEATKTAYASDFSQFVKFCENNGFESLPASSETVGLWITDMAKKGLRPSTIQRRMTAITQAHKVSSLETPIDEIVRKIYSGIRRTIGTATNKRAPITKDILKKTIDKMPSDIIGIRDRAILLIGWSAAMRRSEIVSLNVEDLKPVSEGIIVRFCRSKTDQEGIGVNIGIPFADDEKYCPVLNLNQWLNLTKIKEGAVFRALGPSARNRLWEKLGKRLNAKTISVIVKRRVDSAGFLSNGFGAHSLRSGFCTEAASKGVSERTIMRHTRHASLTVMRNYIQEGTVFTDNPLNGLL